MRTPTPQRPSARHAPRRWLGQALLVALPLVALRAATHTAADVIARRTARWIHASLSLPRFAAGAVTQNEPLERPREPTPDEASSSERVEPASLRRSPPSGGARAVNRRPLTIYVGQEAVKRAIAPSARPSATWTEARAGNPAGVQFTAVGALGSFIRVGDILVEAEGRSLHDMGELIALVGRAYERRSKTVAGRLWRRGELWAVVVEPGW